MVGQPHFKNPSLVNHHPPDLSAHATRRTAQLGRTGFYFDRSAAFKKHSAVRPKWVRISPLILSRRP